MVLIISLGLWKNREFDRSDFRIAIVNNKGLLLKSVSDDRRMVNTLGIGNEVEVWIPRGLGWYKSSKVLGVLDQEKKKNLIDEVLFYNFGFVPDVIIGGDGVNWLTNWQVINKWGWLNYLNYRLKSESMMIRSETINDDLTKSEDHLNEVVQRDFADSRLLREELRISIYNVGQMKGIANFMARNLEWAGLTVVGIDNYQSDDIEQCLVEYGSAVNKGFGYKVLQKVLPDCNWKVSDKLGKMEVEVYFGDGYAQMINYQGYVRTL